MKLPRLWLYQVILIGLYDSFCIYHRVYNFFYRVKEVVQKYESFFLFFWHNKADSTHYKSVQSNLKQRHLFCLYENSQEYDFIKCNKNCKQGFYHDFSSYSAFKSINK